MRRNSTPFSVRSSLKFLITTDALSEPMWRCPIGTKRAPTEAARISSSLIFSPFGSNSSSGAPYSRKTLSTYFTSSHAFSTSPVCSLRSPPMSGRRFSNPSENVPAPPTPHITSHGLHWRQRISSFIRQTRSSTSLPPSTTRTLNPSLTSSLAAKMPAGPHPMITTSYSFFTISPQGDDLSRSQL